MAFLHKAFEWLEKAGDDQSPTEVHALMELIADVRDAWADPENDPIGRELFPVLSDMHNRLVRRWTKQFPRQQSSGRGKKISVLSRGLFAET